MFVVVVALALVTTVSAGTKIQRDDKADLRPLVRRAPHSREESTTDALGHAPILRIGPDLDRSSSQLHVALAADGSLAQVTSQGGSFEPRSYLQQASSLVTVDSQPAKRHSTTHSAIVDAHGSLQPPPQQALHLPLPYFPDSSNDAVTASVLASFVEIEIIGSSHATKANYPVAFGVILLLLLVICCSFHARCGRCGKRYIVQSINDKCAPAARQALSTHLQGLREGHEKPSWQLYLACLGVDTDQKELTEIQISLCSDEVASVIDNVFDDVCFPKEQSIRIAEFRSVCLAMELKIEFEKSSSVNILDVENSLDVTDKELEWLFKSWEEYFPTSRKVQVDKDAFRDLFLLVYVWRASRMHAYLLITHHWVLMSAATRLDFTGLRQDRMKITLRVNFGDEQPPIKILIKDRPATVTSLGGNITFAEEVSEKVFRTSTQTLRSSKSSAAPEPAPAPDNEGSLGLSSFLLGRRGNSSFWDTPKKAVGAYAKLLRQRRSRSADNLEGRRARSASEEDRQEDRQEEENMSGFGSLPLLRRASSREKIMGRASSSGRATRTLRASESSKRNRARSLERGARPATDGDRSHEDPTETDTRGFRQTT